MSNVAQSNVAQTVAIIGSGVALMIVQRFWIARAIRRMGVDPPGLFSFGARR